MLSLLLCHCSHFTDTTLVITLNARSTQLFVILLTTATLFVHTQLVSRLLQSQLNCWSLYLALLLTNPFSLTNVLEMEGSCSLVLESSIATVYVWAFSYMSSPHAYCCCFSCSIYLLVCMCTRWCSLMLHLYFPSLSYSYRCYCLVIYKEFDVYMY